MENITAAASTSLPSRLSKYTVAVPVVAAAIMIMFVILVWQLIEGDQLRRSNAGTRSNAERFASQLEAHVATRLDIGEYIAQEWSRGNIKTIEEFQRETDPVHKLFRDFQAINWVDTNGVVQWVTPLEGNEAVLGLDIRALKIPSTVLAEAERTRRMQVTPPITLTQGGLGFVGYYPLQKNGLPDGTLTIVFRARSLVDGAFRDGVGDEYHFVVSDGENEIYDSANMAGPHPHLRIIQNQFQVGNRIWTVSVMPTVPHLKRIASIIDEIVLVVGLILVSITAYLIHLLMARQLSLRESEERFRDFANVSSDWFWEMDANLKFSFFSDHFEDVTGVPPKALLGKTREETGIPDVDPAAWAKHLDNLKYKREFHDFIHPRTGADGDIVWISIGGIPIFNEAGDFLGYRGTGSDVTVRKKAEIELLRNQHQLKTAVEFAKIGYWEWDEIRDCATYYTQDLMEILDIAPEYFAGGELRGEMDREHIHPDDLKRYIYIVNFSDGTEDRYDISYRAVKRNDDITYCREIGEAVRNKSGKIIRSFGTVQDVTDTILKENALEKALADAERANQSKSEFLATMSHEFRTPLNAILGFSEMMRAQYFGPLGSDNYSEYANDIHGSGKHMLALVNDVLDIATIEVGKRSLSLETINIRDVVMDCFRNVEPAAKAAHIELFCDAPDNLPNLLADKRSIYQIILNLLSNAIKFTQQNGSISVSLKSIDQAVTVTVTDTGVGIEPERMPTITDPFSQSHVDPHITQEGTGLGLSIVKSLVSAHDGTLDIKSDVGKGTAVSVTFPSPA